MENFNPGTIVYFCWYDFQHKKEYTLTGEVVDNSDWGSTQWQDYVNVRFHPPGMKAVICHHFKADKLALDQSSVPHDDCTLVCAKRMSVNTNNPSASDTWKMVQQFKQDHWDYQHGHISTEALDEYYQLWRNSVAAKRGFKAITLPYPEITSPYQEITQGYSETSASAKSASEPQQPKRTKKEISSNVIELSLF